MVRSGNRKEAEDIEPIMTRCGYHCYLCFAYKPNVAQNPSNQQKLGDGWYECFGFRLSPSEICCDGCVTDNPKLIDRSCPVRPCVIEKEIDNCSQCEHYVCDKLRERLVVYEQVRLRLGADILAEDRTCFIRANVQPKTGHSPDADLTGSGYDLPSTRVNLIQREGGNDYGYSHRCKSTAL
jgi:hypothetical protein